MIENILGLSAPANDNTSDHNEVLNGALELLINLRRDAKANKDWATCDKIRDELKAIGIELKDTKDA